MSVNPVSIARLAANVALVAVIAAFLVFAFLLDTGPDGIVWAWIIGAVAIAGACAQLLVSAIWPGAVIPAWDEQVQASNRTSYAFGYWAVMVTFLILFALVQADMLAAGSAFYLLAPVLGASPSFYMALAALRGRAG